jgi:hypothetical protein
MSKFHVKYRPAITLLYIAILFVAILLLQPTLPLKNNQILGFFYLIMPLFLIWYIGVLSISDEGMILKRVNKLRWEDITEARKSKFLWFDTIYIKRKKGVAWSLPLYLVGQKTMKDALLSHAPKDNPIYKVAIELP